MTEDNYGMIMKITFESSGLKPGKYLQELSDGEWDDVGWGTPRDLMKGGIAGFGRTKLMLYDTNVRGITAEFNVERVVDLRAEEPDFPYKNIIQAGTVKLFSPPHSGLQNHRNSRSRKCSYCKGPLQGQLCAIYGPHERGWQRGG